MKTLMENWNRFVNEEEGDEAAAQEPQFKTDVRGGDMGNNMIVSAIDQALRKHDLYVGSFRDLKNLGDIQDMIQRLEDQGYAPSGPGAIKRGIGFAKYLTKDKEKLAAFAEEYKRADRESPFAVFARLFVTVAANDAKLRAIGDRVLDAAMSMGRLVKP
jgi:hypothetical protein